MNHNAMSMTSFAESDVAALLRIAGEVNEIAPTADVHARRTHILQRLLALIGGCWAVCSEIDRSYLNDNGWAVPQSITCAGQLTSYQQDIIGRYVTGKLGEVDPSIPPLLKRRGPVVTVRRVDVVDRSWYRSDHFNLVRRPIGFGESLYGLLTTPDGRRLKLSLHREMNDAPFTERHLRLLHVFNENLASLYVAPAPTATAAQWPARPQLHTDALPGRLRPVLQRLLAGDGEKQAAIKLGLSPHTVHEYTKILYRTLGVNSRGELLARFVDAAAV